MTGCAGSARLERISGPEKDLRLEGAKVVEAATPERSSGIGARPRFRSTVPGMATRSTARPGGVRIAERVEGLGDGLLSPLQASALTALPNAMFAEIVSSKSSVSCGAVGSVLRITR